MSGLLGPVTANPLMLAQALKAREQPRKQLTGQGLLDTAAIGLSPVPVIGDALGLAADASRFYNEPESRTPLNFGLAALGAIPFIPPLVSMGLGKFAQSQGKTLSTPSMSGPAKNQAGAIVYHGSPHKFDQFDSSKIGTGEGAQAYGHGLYFAENPKVAKEYQQATSKDRFLTSNGFFEPSELEHLNVRSTVRTKGLDEAIELARKYGAPDEDYPEVAAKAARDLVKLEALKASGGIRPNPGSLYKVDLPDEAIAKMLDWDLPLSKQPEQVKKLAEKVGVKDPNAVGVNVFEEARRYLSHHPEGKNIYQNMNPSVAQSMLAKEFGIPGVRYLDGMSRGGGQGTSNYVVFPGNEGLLKILSRE